MDPYYHLALISDALFFYFIWPFSHGLSIFIHTNVSYRIICNINACVIWDESMMILACLSIAETSGCKFLLFVFHIKLTSSSTMPKTNLSFGWLRKRTWFFYLQPTGRLSSCHLCVPAAITDKKIYTISYILKLTKHAMTISLFKLQPQLTVWSCIRNWLLVNLRDLAMDCR